ncbi:killer cell lectin-like receptor subfamily B member 1B allele C [Hypanus sabinus]|uniref:killer cell lectin-like receptor subfamily B member 1B allele C n=1 Tax=Hypanus sabinus TaxID=79690 RepID=UPI0028C45199|nr:killer cell lectin-like receptor subfamily B member 1B allele C [Hypanus sabinus]
MLPYLSPKAQRILGRMDRSESHMNVKLGKTDSRSPSRDTQRILDRIDGREASMNKKCTNTGSGAPSRDDVTSTYTELNIRKVEPADGLDPTYSQLNFRQNELHIAEDDDPSVASGPGKMPLTAQAGPHTEQPKDKIRKKPDRKICLLCLVTSALIAIVAGLSICVLQIRQSQISSDKNYTLFCQFLTSKREQACSQHWIKNEDRCYFISTLETSYDEAKKYCSNIDAMLLEINSEEEKNVVSKSLVHPFIAYWIGKCEAGEAASSLMYRDSLGRSTCRNCDSDEWKKLCKSQHSFICEKRSHLFTDIPEKIRDLCQQSQGPN